MDYLFPSVAVLHKRYETPARAIAFQAVLASVLVAGRQLQRDRFVFYICCGCVYWAHVVALFKFRREDAKRSSVSDAGLSGDADRVSGVDCFAARLARGNNPKQAFLGVGGRRVGLAGLSVSVS